MVSMAQALAKAGVVTKDKADKVEAQKEARVRRLHGMKSKLMHLERETVELEQKFHYAMSRGEAPDKLMEIARRRDQTKLEADVLRNDIVSLSAR